MAEVVNCPKCGWQNKPQSATCANCFAPMKEAPTPASPPPGQQTPQQYAHAHYPQPARTGIGAGWIVVALILLGVLGAIVVLVAKPRTPPKPTVAADVVAEQFLLAKKTGESSKCRPHLSKASIKKLDTAFSAKAARSAGFDEAEVARMYLFDADPAKSDIVHSQMTIKRPATVDEKTNQAVVALELKRLPPHPEAGEVSTHELVMVNEDGNWRVDLILTAERCGEGELEHFIPGPQ